MQPPGADCGGWQHTGDHLAHLSEQWGVTHQQGGEVRQDGGGG